MSAPKTRPTGQSVTAFLDSVPDERRRSEGHELRSIMERITGEPATMWGPSMVGFGTDASGSADWFVLGFAPRRAALTLYGVHDGDAQHPELGPHTTGQGCLYLKRLDAVDRPALETLIRNAWERRSG